MDNLGSLPKTKSGNQYVTVLQDRYTKLTRSKPSSTVTSRSISTVLFDNCVMSYGIPIYTDRQWTSFRIEDLRIQDNTIGNEVPDDNGQSTSDHLPRGKIQKSSRCTPPTLHRRAIDRLGRVYTPAGIRTQHKRTQIEKHNSFPPCAVLSGPWFDSCKPDQPHT